MNTFIALIKREILEHGSLWKVPVGLIGFAVLVRLSLVFGNLALDVNVPTELNLDSTINSVVDGAIGKGLLMVNSVVVFAMYVVAVFYTLSALFSERQDQSVLFWRSLPITDSMTVASKLAVAVILVPLTIVVLHAVLALIFLGTSAPQFLMSYYPESIPSLASTVVWSLLPTAAWCLFCSEYAQRNPFLLAFMAPIALVIIDRLFLDGFISRLVVVNRVFGSQDHSALPLIVGLILSVVLVALAIIKRSQRI